MHDTGSKLVMVKLKVMVVGYGSGDPQPSACNNRRDDQSSGKK